MHFIIIVASWWPLSPVLCVGWLDIEGLYSGRGGGGLKNYLVRFSYGYFILVQSYQLLLVVYLVMCFAFYANQDSKFHKQSVWKSLTRDEISDFFTLKCIVINFQYPGQKLRYYVNLRFWNLITPLPNLFFLSRLVAADIIFLGNSLKILFG